MVTYYQKFEDWIGIKLREGKWKAPTQPSTSIRLGESGLSQSSEAPEALTCKPVLGYFSVFLSQTPSLQDPSEAELLTHHSAYVLPSPGRQFFRKLSLEIVTSE